MPNFGPNGVVYFFGLMMNKLNPSIQFWAQSTRGLQIAFTVSLLFFFGPLNIQN